MDRQAQESLAAELLDAWKRKVPLTPSAAPADLAEAYAVQALVVAGTGQTAGYKAGYTNAALQERFGIPGPISGRLFTERIFESGTALPVPGELGLVVEPEFAYRLQADLPAAEAPFTAARVAAAIEWVAPSLEIVEPRLADWQRCGVPLTVADNVLHSAWIRGTPIADWDPAAVVAQEVVASINGAEVSRGSGAAVLGDPQGVMVWLANELASRGESLRAGEIVTTGCTTDALTPSKGDEVRADFGPFGSVSVRLPG